MPELAEVEVISRQIEGQIKEKKITACEILLPRMIRNASAEEFTSMVLGNTVVSFARRGKYMICHFSSGAVMIIHLRMTGRLIFVKKGETILEKYPRIIFTFNDESQLIFGDTRTLGGITIYPNDNAIDDAGFLKLGIEPLSSQFTGRLCYNLTRKSKKPIKAFLLDQQYIAGLGNIYADEALFLSGIRPTRVTHTITKEEAYRLHKVIRSILRKSIQNGGTTFRDYRDGAGAQGINQNFLFVYGRKGQPCRKCGNTLLSTTLAGRTTVFCEHCQQ